MFFPDALIKTFYCWIVWSCRMSDRALHPTGHCHGWQANVEQLPRNYVTVSHLMSSWKRMDIENWKCIENWSSGTIKLHLPCQICRKILNWIRQRAAKKAEKKAAEENLYTRWEQDKDLQAYPDMGLFTEYLEMGMFRPLNWLNTEWLVHTARERDRYTKNQTGPRQWREPGLIVSRCAGQIHCTSPGPFLLQCE